MSHRRLPRFLPVLTAGLCAISTVFHPLPVVAETRLTVHHDAAHAAWGDYVRKQATAFLAAAQTYLGRPSPYDVPVVLTGAETVFLNGYRIGGYNTPATDGIHLEYGISPIGSPALVCHELGHYWFDSMHPSVAWLHEGIVSFLPVAMAEAGVLALDEAERAIIPRHFSYSDPPLGPDRPVAPDPRSPAVDSRAAFYQKTFRIQYLLYKELGKAGYRQFVQQVASHRDLTSDAQIIALLNDVKPQDWRAFLSGWVYAGAYGPTTPTDFTDADHDGLLGIDERYLGTRPDKWDTDDDLIPDGDEIRLGLDPTKPDPPKLVARYAPFADGRPDEWALLPAIRATGADRLTSTDGYRLNAVRLLVRRRVLHLLIEASWPQDPAADIWIGAITDRNGDRVWDRSFGLMLAQPTTAWQYVAADKATVPLPGLRAGCVSVVEISIPLGSSQQRAFHFLPLIRSIDKDVNLAEWDTWIPVSESL